MYICKEMLVTNNKNKKKFFPFFFGETRYLSRRHTSFFCVSERVNINANKYKKWILVVGVTFQRCHRLVSCPKTQVPHHHHNYSSRLRALQIDKVFGNFWCVNSLNLCLVLFYRLKKLHPWNSHCQQIKFSPSIYKNHIKERQMNFSTLLYNLRKKKMWKKRFEFCKDCEWLSKIEATLMLPNYFEPYLQ